MPNTIHYSPEALADMDETYEYIRYDLIFYRQIEHDVFIDRIMHGSRDYINILFGSEIK